LMTYIISTQTKNKNRYNGYTISIKSKEEEITCHKYLVGGAWCFGRSLL
jgi:hypothetical protein